MSLEQRPKHPPIGPLVSSDTLKKWAQSHVHQRIGSDSSPGSSAVISSEHRANLREAEPGIFSSRIPEGRILRHSLDLVC